MRKYAACALVMLVSLTATAPAAVADPTVSDTAPVKIESCSASEQAVIENPKVGIRTAQVSGITIVYNNAAAVAATDVRFRIRYGGGTYTLDDRGSLAAGHKISREFTSIDASYRGTSADCTVAAVTFADGTGWTASAPPPSPVPSAPGPR